MAIASLELCLGVEAPPTDILVNPLLLLLLLRVSSVSLESRSLSLSVLLLLLLLLFEMIIGGESVLGSLGNVTGIGGNESVVTLAYCRYVNTLFLIDNRSKNDTSIMGRSSEGGEAGVGGEGGEGGKGGGRYIWCCLLPYAVGELRAL